MRSSAEVLAEVEQRAGNEERAFRVDDDVDFLRADEDVAVGHQRVRTNRLALGGGRDTLLLRRLRRGDLGICAQRLAHQRIEIGRAEQRPPCARHLLIA